MSSYKDMVARIAKQVEEGKAPEALTPGDIIEMDGAVLAKLIAKDNRTKRTAGGEGDMNIRFAYVEDREYYGVVGSKRGKGTEQFVDEHSDKVILTLAGKRYRDRTGANAQASLDACIELHHAFDGGFAAANKMALVTVNPNGEAPDVDWFSAGREDVIEVILPKSYSDEQMTDTNDHSMLLATAEWRTVPEGAAVHEADGVPLLATYANDAGVTIARVLSVPIELFEASGKLITEGPSKVDWWCTMIAQIASNPGAAVKVVEVGEPTEQDIELYDAAKLMISMTKAAMQDNKGKVDKLKLRVERANNELKDLMANFIERERARIKDAAELHVIESGDQGRIAAATGHLLTQYELIANDEPVKSARLFERDGDTIIAVQLHPLVVNTNEAERRKAGTWPEDRGDPTHRLMNHIRFELNLGTGQTDPGRILKWIHPDRSEVKEGFDTRAHPHSYVEGGACWGQLGTPFAEAIARSEWHTALQWVLNYCANPETEPHHDHHCMLWRLPPAPEGIGLGFVIPDTEDAKLLEGWDPDPAYGGFLTKKKVKATA